MGDLDRLRTFLAVHRTGSVTQAAHLLHMSQPAVTQQLQALEATAGRPLFRRMRRGMEPTPAGDELAAELGTHVDAIEESWGQWLGRASGAGRGEQLRGYSVFLGGPSEFLAGRVLPALGPLIAAGLRLRVRTGDDALSLDLLERHELDLAVLTAPVRRSGLRVEALVREELVLVGAPDVAVELGEVRPGKRGARKLQDARLLAYAEDLPLVRAFWHEVFGGEPEGVGAVVADSLPALVVLAERGIGVTVLPMHACEDALASGRLVRVVRPRDAPTSPLYLAWWAGTRRTPGVAAVFQRLSTIFPATPGE